MTFRKWTHAFLAQVFILTSLQVPTIASSIISQQFLAPSSSFTDRTKGKPTHPVKRIHENLTDEEIRVLRLYEELDTLNMSLYTAEMARTHSRRQKEALEKKIQSGEEGLKRAASQLAETERSWEQQIKHHIEHLAAIKEEFSETPKPNRPLLVEAHAFLQKAFPLIERNMLGAAEATLVGAKNRIMREYRELVDEHLEGIPRIRAVALMGKTRFGQDIQSITMGGFGMRVLKNGRVTVPTQHYHKDKRQNLWVLRWHKDKLAKLPPALRQRVHIQESEYAEFHRVTGFMKALVDIKSQLTTEGKDLNQNQRKTLSHLLLMLILRISPQAPNTLIKEQTKHLQTALRPILTQLMIRGEARKAFLKKATQAFREAQTELATSDNLILKGHERRKRIDALSKQWEELLNSELKRQGIQLDKIARKNIGEQWHKTRANYLISDIGELITRIDPYGQIRDPHKQHALRHIRLAAELLSVGRVDRNAPDFLETAQAFLYKRLEATRSIRRAVRKQEAALRAELRRIEKRDADISERLDKVEKALRVKRDLNSAGEDLVRLANAHFSRALPEPGMQRARARLKAMVQLLETLRKPETTVAQARDTLEELDNRIGVHFQKMAGLGEQYQQYSSDPLAPNKKLTEYLVVITSIREKLQRLTQERKSLPKSLKSQMQSFLQATPKVMARGLPGARYTASRLRNLIPVVENFVAGELADFPDNALRNELVGELAIIVSQLKEAKAIAEDYVTLVQGRREAQKFLSLYRKTAAEMLAKRRSLRMQLSKAENTFARAVQGPLHDNIAAIRQDLIHKYYEVVPREIEKPASKTLDYAALRRKNREEARRESKALGDFLEAFKTGESITGNLPNGIATLSLGNLDIPILTLAPHGGHLFHEKFSELRNWAINDTQLNSEVDVGTQLIAGRDPNVFTVHTSRAYFDANRSKENALHDDKPYYDVGYVWNRKLTDAQKEEILQGHKDFYDYLETVVREMVKRHGYVILPIIHSYGHRPFMGKDYPTASPVLLPTSDPLVNAFQHEVSTSLGQSLNAANPDWTLQDNYVFTYPGFIGDFLYRLGKNLKAEYGLEYEPVVQYTIEFKKTDYMNQETLVIDLEKIKKLAQSYQVAIARGKHFFEKTVQPKPLAHEKPAHGQTPPKGIAFYTSRFRKNTGQFDEGMKTDPLDFSMLEQGFRVRRDDVSSDVESIIPTGAAIKKLFGDLRAQQGQHLGVKYRVYIPMRSINFASPLTRSEMLLTPAYATGAERGILTKLRSAAKEGLFELIELNTVEDYQKLAKEWNLEEFLLFLTLGQTNRILLEESRPLATAKKRRMDTTPDAVTSSL